VKPANRTTSGRFVPGQSGNINGRPKLVAHVRQLAQEQTEAAIAVLVDVMINGSNESARVQAAQALLDRGYGKAPTEQEVQESEREVMSQVSDSQLVLLAPIAIKLLGDGKA
jgi:hypothetical protein